jgi:hypothetical protein
LIWTRHFLVGLLSLAMGLTVIVVLAVGGLQLMMARGPLPLPQLETYLARQINMRLSGETLSIGAISLGSGAGGLANRVILKEVTLRGADQKTLLKVPEIRTDFSLMNLVRGKIMPSEVEIRGTRIKLVREMDGTIRVLRLTDAGEIVFEGDLLAQLDKILGRDEFKRLKSIALRDTRVSVQDRRSGRSWRVSDSLLALSREGNEFSLRAEVEVGVGLGEKTRIIATAKHRIGGKQADFRLQFANAIPEDIADMVSALDWLRMLDTRVSGSLTASIDQSGVVGALNGVLDLGQGQLRQTPSSVPVGFDQAKVYFSYDKTKDRLSFTQVTVDTSAGRLRSEGYATLQRGPKGFVQSMSGQFRFDNLELNRPELFAAPLKLDAVSVDYRLSFAPLTVEVGAMTVHDGAGVYHVSGKSVAGADYWINRYDIEINSADRARIMDFWPLKAIPRTRKWLVENIRNGRVDNFRGGLRSKGGKFTYAFNFEVNDAQVRFMKTMPELRNAYGFGYLTNKDLRIDIRQGHLIAPDNTRVDLETGSFYIPDIQSRPAIGLIKLVARGGLQAALYLLDVEKFRFLQKVGLSPDVATGEVRVSGDLQVELSKYAKPKDIKFNAMAEVKNLQSDSLIKGHLLKGQRLIVQATQKGLEMNGPVTLDGVPMQAKWTLGFGPLARKGSRVEALLGLSDHNLKGLGITLPKGSISGETPAKVVVNIKKGRTPTYTVQSNLLGARLKVPALQWNKSPKTAGKLTMKGSFGTQPTVDHISLVAPGMKASGKITFKQSGAMKALQLHDLQAGRWLDSAANIEMLSRGNARITLEGGSADLRNFNIETGTGTDGTGGSPVDIRLDRLTIISGLALTDFTARLRPGKGVSGTFSGRVNGGTRITGTLLPHKYGTAFDIRSKDAGRVLASAGFMENVYGGDMWVVINPRAKAGEYDGTLEVKRTRMTNTSAMAGLLNGISVVGILQQLEGEGIHFTTVDGRFLLRPDGVQLKDISAVGPSMGMTLDGWYNSTAKTVDFEGVTTPLYALNGLFERALGKLSGRKKGEGLFSFTYRMKGPAENPKVTVNPLSILTPGVFREIFRRKVPVPVAQDANAQPVQRAAVAKVGGEKTAPKKTKQKMPRPPQTDAKDLR